MGVSGGPDSVALLLSLSTISREGLCRLALTVAHFNHGIRGKEADEDEAFVRDLAERLGFPFRSGRSDVVAFARKECLSLEDAARRERYRFLEEVAKAEGASKVALGHTFDDQAETVLSRLLRGAGLAGLRGVLIRRPIRWPGGDLQGPAIEIIRPLLSITRAEVLAYLEHERAPFRKDSSNLDPEKNLRSRLRLELLPLLEERFSRRLRDHLANLALIATQAHSFLESEAERLWNEVVESESPRFLSLKRDRLKELPWILQTYLIRRALSSFLKGGSSARFSQVESVLGLLSLPAPSSVEGLPGKVVAENTRSAITFRIGKEVESPALPTPIEIPGEASIFGGRFLLETKVLSASEFDLDAFLKEKGPLEEAMDFDRAGGEAARYVVRSRKAGDRFQPLGLASEKKLKDFFIARKVPRGERDSIPILLSDEKIIWVAGLGISEEVKVTKHSRRILLVRLLEGDPT